MCGLVGMAGDLNYADENTMKRLLVYDYFRGTDSTGIAVLRHSGASMIAKMASHPLDLFDSNRFSEALSGYQSSCFLGHNRAATKGKVNGANAHPYEYGSILGAHNGTLDHQSWKRLEQELGFATDVDSQAVIACIDAIGIKDTIELMTEGRTSSDGAWALTWIDKSDGTLNFIRNKWRPLWYAYSKDFKKLFWASEWPMIDAAIALSPASYDLHDENGYRFWEVQENKHYKFDLNELKKGSSKRPNPLAGTIKGREPAPVQSAASGSAPFTPTGGQSGPLVNTTPSHSHGSPTTSNSKGTLTTITYRGTTTTGTVAATPEVVEVPTCPSEPLGVAMSKERFHEIARFGCSWCSKDIEYGTPGITIFDLYNLVLCPEHSDNRGNTRIYTSAEEIRAVSDTLITITENRKFN